MGQTDVRRGPGEHVSIEPACPCALDGQSRERVCPDAALFASCVQASLPVSSGRQRCREGGSPSLLASCAGTFDATSSSMPGELLPPHLPYLSSHVLTYSHLACPWSQSFDRREGHHQVHLLLGICRRAEPPRGSCRRAAPRHATKGCVGPLAAGRGSLVGERARVAARAGVRASADACGRPCRGGRSSCGRPLSCELTRRGRRQGGPVK